MPYDSGTYVDLAVVNFLNSNIEAESRLKLILLNVVMQIELAIV